MPRRLLALVTIGVALGGDTASVQSVIRTVRLADGYDATNQLAAPVVDPARAPAVQVSVSSSYDRRAAIVRRGTSGLFTRGPEYALDPTVDLAVSFTDALTAEARAMGFGVSGGADVWQVTVNLRDIYLESKQIPYGATLFYGYARVDLEVRRGTESPTTLGMRLHDYVGSYNAGIGRRDEAEAALAHLLVEGAQDVWSRLNRLVIKAAPPADLTGTLPAISATSVASRAALHRLALTGQPALTAAVLSAVEREPDEDQRADLIDALADLGDPAAIAPLRIRYADEDEDCRWYTLKAMDYIGGETALAFVRERGLRDDDVGPRRLAERIVGPLRRR